MIIREFCDRYKCRHDVYANHVLLQIYADSLWVVSVRLYEDSIIIRISLNSLCFNYFNYTDIFGIIDDYMREYGYVR